MTQQVLMDQSWAPTGPELAAKFFRGLGDPTRIKILQILLEQGDKNVGELVDLLGSPQGRVSSHLACLRGCGYALSYREGKNVYTATTTGRAVVEEELESIEAMWQRAEEWGDWGPASHPAAIEIARHVEIFARTAFIAVTKKDVDPDTVRQIIERARQEIEQSQMI